MSALPQVDLDSVYLEEPEDILIEKIAQRRQELGDDLLILGHHYQQEAVFRFADPVGASRAVVDAGWRSHDEQVGKSGKTVCPELYIACGISGAIHHVLGMNTAKVVVAINNAPDALVFQKADFGLVGDALQVLPALTQAWRGRGATR